MKILAILPISLLALIPIVPSQAINNLHGVCDKTDNFCAPVIGIPNGEGRYIRKVSGNEVEIQCLQNGDPIVEIDAGDLTMTGELQWSIAICDGDSGAAAQKCQQLPPVVTVGSKNNDPDHVQYFATPQIVTVNVGPYASKFKPCTP